MPLKCSDYFCVSGSRANENDPCIKRPISSSSPGILAPYVRMVFPPMPGLAKGGTAEAGGQVITTIDPNGKPDLTVGNESNLPNNHAGIKSFQYGSSDGNGAEVEIFDEEGGQFDLFVNKLVKVLPDANDFGCSIEWGWTMTDCSGNKIIGPHSSPHFFLILSIDIHYSAGGVVFKIQLQDLMEPLFETRVNDVFTNVRLKDAIIQLFTKKATPKIDSVLFKRYTPGAGGITPCNNLINENSMGNQSNVVDMRSMQDFKFKGNLENGTTDWHCNGQNPLGAVREWIRDKMTDNDKGIIIFWNSTSSRSELVFLEDPLPKCWSSLEQEQCSRSLGTYIVNGGETSPVISFDPQLKFIFAAAAHAGAGVDTETAEGRNNTPQEGCPETKSTNDPIGSGDTTFIQMTENFNQIYGPGNLRLAIRGVAANERANKLYENIEAELKIQGDPTLDNPYTVKIKTVSLVVINPFHLRSSGGNQITSGTFLPGCPEWLFGPPCNQILSNKNWFIKGVSHDIKEGSYTTTLKIYLPAPGQVVHP
jgi:hypothetical protein